MIYVQINLTMLLDFFQSIEHEQPWGGLASSFLIVMYSRATVSNTLVRFSWVLAEHSTCFDSFSFETKVSACLSVTSFIPGPGVVLKSDFVPTRITGVLAIYYLISGNHCWKIVEKLLKKSIKSYKKIIYEKRVQLPSSLRYPEILDH